MEMNRDDSEQCLKNAFKYFEKGDRENALKFVHKSLKLYPLDKAEELLARLKASRAGEDESAASGPSHNSKSPPESGATNGSSRRHEAKTKDYTEEQLVAVKRILKSPKNYYEVLGVSKECTEDDVKKAYKKLALNVHPDKNKAPGADEAFKAIGNAYAILSDPEKKRRYDAYGNDDEIQTGRHRNYQRYQYESELTPEEIFSMFFGNAFGVHTAPTHARRGGRYYYETSNHARNSSEQSSYSALLQLAPILILVFLSVLSSFLVSDPIFNLQRTQKYPDQRTTTKLNVPYYVKPEFKTEYTGNIRRLESQVEEEYLNNLRSGCYREKQYKEQMLYTARIYQNREMFNNANNLGTPSCDKLQEIYSS